jgi:CheY-like chemotaxis protein
LPVSASTDAVPVEPILLQPGALAGCLAGAAIVVVDDDQDSRELCAALLEGAGATVVLCAAAGEALRRLQDTAVDLVIADIAMPEVDGYAFISRVRQRHPNLPALAMTAHARIEDRRRALAAGYTAYRTKPIDGPQLIIEAVDLIARRVAPAPASRSTH